MDRETRYRHEFKYIISDTQIRIIQSRLECLMDTDPNTGPAGFYNIKSLYFDDYQDTCIHDNLCGADPREKFRIRVYNSDPGRIALECKRKDHGKISKTSCLLSNEQYEMLIGNRIASFGAEYSPLLSKFISEMNTRNLRPKVVVGYDRTPFICPMGNVRITLDMNICSSSDIRGLFIKDYSRRPVLPVGMHLLEVKWDDYIPDHLFRACQIESLQQTAFSKYVLCRQYSL